MTSPSLTDILLSRLPELPKTLGHEFSVKEGDDTVTYRAIVSDLRFSGINILGNAILSKVRRYEFKD